MLKKPQTIDLTHELSKETPSWDGVSAFDLSIDTDYKDCTPPDLFRSQKIKCNAGIGTHMDAPAHVVPGGRTIDMLTVDELMADCVVIDVSGEADQNYLIMPSSVEAFENKYGKIQPKTFVIFHTGWSKHWNTPKKYHNDHKFPSIHESTGKLLVGRDIAGLGIDTLSPDTGENGFPVHRAILSADKYIVENVANAKELPPTGTKILVLPIKIKNGTEAPIRLIALV